MSCLARPYLLASRTTLFLATIFTKVIKANRDKCKLLVPIFTPVLLSTSKAQMEIYLHT